LIFQKITLKDVSNFLSNPNDTFDNIVIDLGAGAFTHGQVYVGLSRCTSLQGVILKRPVMARDIIFDERVHEFRNRFLNLI